MPNDTDALTLKVTAERCCEIGDLHIGAGGVAGVVTGERLHHQRPVFDGPGEGAAMIKGKRVGDDAGATDQTIGRLEPGGAAETGRIANGAASI